MKLLTVIVLLGCLLVSPFMVQAKDFSTNIKVGTLGVGVEGEYSFNEYLGARVGANYFKYSYDSTKDNINYDFKLGLKTVAALVDLHPFKGSFRVSTGAFYNGSNLDATAISSATYDIGGHTYTGAELGTLTGTADFKKIAPYLGLGWDTSFGKKSGFGFVFDVGAVFQGSLTAKLSANGPIASDPTFQQDLAIEEAKLQDDLDKFKVYPLVSLGVSYRF